MPKCPECEREIDYLLQAQNGVMESYYDGHTYEEKDFYPNKTRYECPECGEVIAIDEKEARDLLSEKIGGIEYDEM